MPAATLRTEARVWFGVAAAPAAWTLQHVIGYGFSEAACDPVGRGGVGLDTSAAIATALGALLTLAGLAAAYSVYRATDSETPPPEGRRHFLAVVGLTISPLFLAIMLMSGIGAIVLDNCHQS